MMKSKLVLPVMLLTLSAIHCQGASGTGAAPNTWVQLAEDKDSYKFLSSVWFAPASNQFVMWGPGPANILAKRYDVEIFDLQTNAWQDALPKGKLSTWSDGQFPSWAWYGQTAQNPGNRLVKGAAEGKVADHLVGGYASCQQVDFVNVEGDGRPTRCPTFNQVCYDSKRGRLLFFLGGKTFSYDSKERTWSDLKPAKVPLGCEALVWASLCYDAVNDQAVLFGGGMALNSWGGARTWLYDCAKNEWTRPDFKLEPPLRCNARMVYDSRNKLIVLFGGDDQAKALNDTWVYNVARHEWSERKPPVAPPPTLRYAATYLEKQGLVFVCGPEDTARTCHTWTYDAAGNTWTPVKGTIPACDWMSCDYSARDDAVVLVTTSSNWWDPIRHTYVYHFDPPSAEDKRAGEAPGTFRWKHDGQRASVLGAPAPDRKSTEAQIKNLPLNQWVDANPPGAATSKTWSDCTMDTDKGVILYYGGGHSAYSGSDVAHYDIGANRWSLAYDPEFPPYLESTNRTVFGWSYNFHPWSEHTRRWYAYDPVSKTLVYVRQGSDFTGHTLFLGKDGKKELKSTGSETWLYDPSRRKFFEPTFDRPWSTDDGTCLVTTPRGVYALSAGKLWLCKVSRQGKGDDESCTALWTKVAEKGPVTGDERNPTLYDSKRERLITMIAGKSGPEMWCFDLASSVWSKADCKGQWTPTREACYVPAQDAIFQVTYGIDGATTTHQIYRCATNEWVQGEIEFPKKGPGLAAWDTSFAFDPVHNVVVLLNTLGCNEPSTVFLLRYDDKTLKMRGAAK